jgi:hypothetical protein
MDSSFTNDREVYKRHKFYLLVGGNWTRRSSFPALWFGVENVYLCSYDELKIENDEVRQFISELCKRILRQTRNKVGNGTVNYSGLLLQAKCRPTCSFIYIKRESFRFLIPRPPVSFSCVSDYQQLWCWKQLWWKRSKSKLIYRLVSLKFTVVIWNQYVRGCFLKDKTDSSEKEKSDFRILV